MKADLVSNEIVLSIVVPTRERYRTLIFLIERTLEWQRSDFELVIQDNSLDNKPIQRLLSRYRDDERLRYFHDPVPVSAPENCERAVAKARGQIVTFVGDDDCVSAHAIVAARWMTSNAIDAIVAPTAQYTWPDSTHAATINNRFNGKLILPHFDGSVKELDHRAELLEAARLGAGGIRSIPRLYHGLVKRDRLTELKSVVGRYFPGPIPDMPNAVALSRFLKKTVAVQIPLIVSGQSPQSMSGQNALRKHQGEISSNVALPVDTEARWDARLPRYWSGPNIWAEGMLKGAQNSGQSEVEQNFNFNWVYARNFVYTKRHFYPRIVEALRRNGDWYAIRQIPVIGLMIIQLIFERAKVYAGKLMQREVGVASCAHIGEVLDYMESNARIASAVEAAFSPAATN